MKEEMTPKTRGELEKLHGEAETKELLEMDPPYFQETIV